MEEQIINLKKVINIQSNKINSLEKRILILENNKKVSKNLSPVTDTIFNRLGNKKTRQSFPFYKGSHTISE